jgi:hypothetical protein
MKKRKDHLEESNKRGRWKMREKERRGACVFCLCIWPLCCCCCYIVYVNDDGELSLLLLYFILFLCLLKGFSFLYLYI